MKKGQVVVYKHRPGLFRVIEAVWHDVLWSIEPIEDEHRSFGEAPIRAWAETLIPAEKLGLWPPKIEFKADPSMAELEEASYKAKRDENLRRFFVPEAVANNPCRDIVLAPQTRVISIASIAADIAVVPADVRFLKALRDESFGLKSDFMERYQQRMSRLTKG